MGSDFLMFLAVIVAAWIVVQLITFGHGPPAIVELASLFKVPFLPKPSKPTFKEAVVIRAFEPGPGQGKATGKVRADGSIWNAECPADQAERLAIGDRVHVSGCEGLTLKVRDRRTAS